jgi:hypothetical protein
MEINRTNGRGPNAEIDISIEEYVPEFYVIVFITFDFQHLHMGPGTA